MNNPPRRALACAGAAVVAAALVRVSPVMAKRHVSPSPVPTYLPDPDASRSVSVVASGSAATGITIVTQAVATKESGPKPTVKRFGEVYVFSPSFIAVHRDEPTQLSFWNLQADDEHDFMLVDPRGSVLMHVLLPPLRETNFTFTFHEEGLFMFYCTMHQPEMSGQVLVLPKGS
jgi:plastocyanin